MTTDQPQPDAPTRQLRRGVSVVIPSYNEELNLPHALKSCVAWADAVFVVDSESTDATRDIAEEMGARVVVQPWLGYAKQKNWALENLPIETEWVFILDSDESITPELRDELLGIAQRDAAQVTESGYYVNRLTYFLGKPVRHGGFYPSYNLRFFKLGRARYEDREVHEHMIVDGPSAQLKNIMLHEDRRGLEHFIAKHNRYSTLEARELWRGKGPHAEEKAKELELGIAFRRWLKYTIQPRLPFVGLWRFFYMYFLRLGFLDGVTGFRFCLLLSIYDSFIGLKLAELRALQRDNPGADITTNESRVALARAEGSEVARAIPKTQDGAGEAASPPPSPAAPAAPKRRPVESATPKRRLPAEAVRAFTPTDAVPDPRPPVSVIVLTYNEEDNIVPCLESCAWCDDVHVLDSGSQDRTRELAEQLGATVHVNPFKSFGQQRNWAIDNIPVKYRWQFQMDADERFTPAIVEELGQRIRGDESVDGACAYHCPSMMMFMDEWLTHAADYPVYQVRLIDKERCRFEDYGHGQREVPDGPVGALRLPYMHYNFSKGLEEWFEKHNRYSSLEAQQALAIPRQTMAGSVRGLMSRDPLVRRRTLKAIGYRVPLRATIFTFYTMVVRLGFLDGVAGLNYTRMRSTYEGMVAVKMSVLRHKRKRGDSSPGC